MAPAATRAGRPDGKPSDRYGAPRPWTRPLTVTVIVALAVVGGGWLLWAALHHAKPDAVARLDSYEVVADQNEVRVTIRIERQSDVEVTCLLKAQAADHAIVGEREVTVAAGGDEVVVETYLIETERDATTGVLSGCTTSRPD
ncbi:MAG: DUF4307 domain-containing protein [Nocardioidaceae bacterium]